jgi:hypothetical protein
MTDALALTERLCSMCPSKATSRYESCRCSRYCSKACQKDDWKVHKLVCKTFQEPKTQAPPEPGYSRAIFFDVQKAKLEWVWVRMTARPGETNLNLECYMISADQVRDLGLCSRSAYNHVLKCPHEAIQMLGCLRPDPALGGMPVLTGAPNPSIASIAPNLLESFKGPILFTGQSVHLDTMSFRHIVDYIRFEYAQAVQIRGNELSGGDTLGVRISYMGDLVLLNRPPVESCKVNSSFCDLGKGYLTPVASKLGIDVTVQKEGEDCAELTI